MINRHVLIAVLCVAWILPGLIGHDPWKPDEAQTFGVVYDLLRSGDWVVPHLAGEPFLADPPLFYLTAAATSHLFGSFLPLHDAARLATGLYMAIAFVFCGCAGREINGRTRGALAMLLLLGSFGLVVRSHQLISGIAALAGFAMSYYGCALARRTRWGGFWLGTGMGVVFLSQGTLQLAVILLIAGLAPLVHRSWRTSAYWQSCLIALVCALPWVSIWPLALYSRSPEFFHTWIDLEIFERIRASRDTPLYYVNLLPWYGWPLWVLGLWSLWRAKQKNALDDTVALPLLGFAVTLVALSVAADQRELYALPLLVPLALLATPAIETLRRGAANAWYWFSIMGFTFFIIVGWFYWCALELGVPAQLHQHLHSLQPGYPPGFRLLPFVLGACYTVAWFVVVAFAKRTPQRPAIIWAAGVTVIWALIAILFVGWVDTGKSYRSVMLSLHSAMPKQYRCMASSGLGDAQRAMLEYYTGTITRRVEDHEDTGSCDLLLVQAHPSEDGGAARGWRKVWEGQRPGDRSERYYLYRHARR